MGPPAVADPADPISLPWLEEPLRQALALTQSHALLVHGAPGVGQLEFALTLVQAWLCEGEPAPCGRCASCRLVRSRSHPDLRLVVPDQLALALDWVALEDLRLKGEAKPSKDIRVEQVRQAIDWSHATAGRGRGKALLLHPGEAMNQAAASALLKTLEEPAGDLRIVVTAEDPERLLPTVRSRCQRLLLRAPDRDTAMAWLRGQGVKLSQDDVHALLRLAAGSPLLVVELAHEGWDAALCAALPAKVADGSAAPVLAGRPLPRVIDLLLKLAHDAAAVAVGGEPRYFSPGSVPSRADLARLTGWQRSLMRAARHDEHPWNAGLLVEALVTEGAQVWPRAGSAAPRGQRQSLHSAR